jgi:hypothetical protein
MSVPLTSQATILIQTEFPTAVDSNAIISAAKNSDFLAGEFNAFAANGGKFIVSTNPALGITTSTNQQTITLQSYDLPSNDTPTYVMVETIAYEFGHALLLGGEPVNNASSPAQAVSSGDNSEGVSLGSAYIVATQLQYNRSKWDGDNAAQQRCQRRRL